MLGGSRPCPIPPRTRALLFPPTLKELGHHPLKPGLAPPSLLLRIRPILPLPPNLDVWLGLGVGLGQGSFPQDQAHSSPLGPCPVGGLSASQYGESP